MASSDTSVNKLAKASSKNVCKPMANLEPIRRSLYRIDTERIYRVIQDVISRFEEWGLLLSILADDKQIFSISDEELRNLLLQQQDLMAQMESGKVDVHEDIMNSLKDIFRYTHLRGISFKTYTNDIDVGHNLPVFYNTLKELSVLILERLLTEKDEEIERNKYLLKNMEKARASIETIVKLEKTLNQKVQEKEHELNESDRVIRRYKQKIEAFISSARDENNAKLNEAAKSILTQKKGESIKTKKMQQEIMECKRKLTNLRTANYQEESLLRKRKFKMATELRNWIRKYDGDMGWRQEELDGHKADNENDLEEIRQAQIHFAEVEKQYLAIMEERRLAEEERQRQLEEHMRIVRAVTIIQAIARGYLVRKAMRKQNKKDKKGKGKGKKKK